MMDAARGVGLTLDQHRLCARVARLYYESELTQEQIGEVLGLSRMKVNRLLGLARQSGVVQIQVHSPDEPFAELQEQLLSDFGLQDVRLVATEPSADGLRSNLASGASAWLVENLQPGLVVGFGLGRTVGLLPNTFSVGGPVKCTFVTVEGVGVSPNAGYAAYEVAARLADAAGGVAEIVSAPTFVSDSGLRDALLSEPSVSASLDVARAAGIVVQSVGTVTLDAPLFRHGTLSEADLKKLRNAGAVGDALGHFFNEAGDHIPWETDDRHIGLTLDDLKKLPTSALVAGGEDKTTAVRAAIRGGYFNALITDESTAERLLDMGP